MWRDFSFCQIFSLQLQSTDSTQWTPRVSSWQGHHVYPFPFLLWSKRWQRVEETAVEFSAAKGHLKHLCAGINLTCKSLLLEQCGAYRGPSAVSPPRAECQESYNPIQVYTMCVNAVVTGQCSHSVCACSLVHVSLSSPFVFAICILYNFAFKIFLRRDHFYVELNNPRMHLCCLLAWR